VFELDSLKTAKTWGSDCAGVEKGRVAERNGDLVRFYRHGNCSIKPAPLPVYCDDGQNSVGIGGRCTLSAVGSCTIWQLFPEEIILLTAPLRIQVTKVVMKNIGYRGFNFQLTKRNLQYNEVTLEIKLQILKLCIFGKLGSKYSRYTVCLDKKPTKNISVWKCVFGYCL